MLAAKQRHGFSLRRMLDMRSSAAEVPGCEPPPGLVLRRARYLGAVLGLLMAGFIGTAIPKRPPKDSLPGFAAQNGLDVPRPVLVFFLVLALPIAGGLIASAWARRRGGRPSETGGDTWAFPARSLGFRASAVAAHAATLWIFVCSGFPGITGRLEWVLAGVFGVSAILAFLLHRGDSRFGILCLGAASPLLLLTLVAQRPIPLSREAAVAAVLLPVSAF